MKAKLIKEQDNGRNYSNEKELVDRWKVVGNDSTDDDKIVELVDCRAWMGRSRNASVVYATLWAHANGIYTSGKGTAGGYGYHKPSAAVNAAIHSAGFELYGAAHLNRGEEEDLTKRAYIDGVGDSAIETALLAIAEEIGRGRYKNLRVIS